MKQWKLHLALIFTMLYLPTAFAASPEGSWITVDDKTGKERAVITMQVVNGVLNGKITKIIYKDPGDTGICTKCPAPFKDKPIIGLQFLWGLKDKGDGVWSGGEILDAKTGKIYRVKMTVKEDKLYVRGYVGLSMLGRTQVWLRQKS